MITLAEKIVQHILGRKYYLVTISNPTIFDADGNNPTYVSSYIFRRKEDATQFFYDLRHAKSASSVEIVSFRSRKEYRLHNDGWKTPLK